MDGDGGILAPENSSIGRELRGSYDKLCSKGTPSGTVPLYKEQGVYNYYLRMKDIKTPTVTKHTTMSVPKWHP